MCPPKVEGLRFDGFALVDILLEGAVSYTGSVDMLTDVRV